MPDDPIDLDPTDWGAYRTQAHRMLDDIIDFTEHVRSRPVWQPMPAETRAALREPLPRAGAPLEAVHAEFKERILPFATGNVHPRFMGWVHGGGNVFGMLGEMLAAGMNPNTGGRDHSAIEVERQIVRWLAELFDFPATAGGLLVTGTSIANFICVAIARVDAAGADVRRTGADGHGLVAYTSAGAHGCIPRAMDMVGLGSDALRLVAVDENHRMDVAALGAAIARDRAAGKTPFLVVATAGTVDTGAIDDLSAIAQLCRRERLWFHVDGAFGALGVLAPSVRPLLKGIELADSIAFDFHKWGQVPYDAGCILVRDEATQLRAFAFDVAYLRKESRGLAGNAPWPCDLGPDLSRGFRALKIWFTLKTLGADRLGQAIDRTCAVARHLAARVDREPELERMAPVALNIVCFRYRFADDADRRTIELVADLQESGIAAPSTTKIDGHVVIRCALVNHRTQMGDVDAVVDAVLALGRRR